MQVKSIVSVIALSAALAFSGPTFAQTVVHGMTISEADMARVEALCTDLRNAAANTTAGEGDSVDGDDAETPPAANAADQALSDVDLAKITLEDCDAGKIGVE